MDSKGGNHLKEIVEIVGVVSIVTSLLLVAWEIRQSNRIASAEVAVQLTDRFDGIHGDRLGTPEVARLFPKLKDPESHLLTATELSQLEALAWRYVNAYRAAQLAYDSGLLTREQFEVYLTSADGLISAYPGLRPHLVAVVDRHPEFRELEVLRVIVESVQEPVYNQ